MGSIGDAHGLTIADIALDESLVARARDLEPIIREHVETTERERRLARPVLQVMREAGLFRMFTPRALGGLEADPVTVARVTEEIATFDTAAAWAAGRIAPTTMSWYASLHLDVRPGFRAPSDTVLTQRRRSLRSTSGKLRNGPGGLCGQVGCWTRRRLRCCW